MTQSRNPFCRGFQNPRIERQACIACDDPLVWRPLLPDQAHWPDDRIARSACVFNDDFVLILDPLDQDAPDGAPDDDADARFPSSGVVQYALHAVIGDDAGQPAHLGDFYSREAAQEFVQRLRCETGFFSRAWEISSAHLSTADEAFLAGLADRALAGNLFVAFRIPGSPAIGVKLIATPWTDAHLLHVEGISANDLRQQHRDAGVPDALADALALAGEADVRFLVFDGDAPVLDGLPVYDAL
jgi:hypothetical protein